MGGRNEFIIVWMFSGSTGGWLDFPQRNLFTGDVREEQIGQERWQRTISIGSGIKGMP
jgi:hypothetical protein